METNTLVPVPSTTYQPQKIGKVKGGYMVVMQSLKLLNSNRSMVLFPIFAALASGAAIAFCVFIYIFFFVGAGGAQYLSDKTIKETIVYALYFVFYFVTTFIVSFFQAGLAIAISSQINGRNLSFSESMAQTAKYSGKILKWSLIWATVGVLMEIISSKGKLAGRIATAIFGVAWGAATFFIVPVLVLENGSIKASLRRSVDIFKKKWGETIIANFAASLYFLFIWAIGLVIFMGYMFLGQPGLYLGISLAAIFIIFTIAIAIISSTVEGIFRVVLYEYAANDKIAPNFSQDLVVGAMKK